MSQGTWRTPLAILICATAVLLISMGVRMTYGLWLAPASADLGWGREQLSLAMAVQALMWGVATPLSGVVADRYGAGRVVAAAGTLYTLGLFLMSRATTPAEAMFSIGFLTGIAMSGSMFPLVLAVISRAVEDDKKRAVYLGIASSAGSSGMFVMVPGVQAVLDSHGWTGTLVALAAVTALIVPLSAALAGGNRAAVGAAARQPLGHALREAGAHKGYLLLASGYFVCGFQTLFIADHFPSMMRSYDVSAGMGAWAISLIGLFNIIGCFFWGTMGGWVRKKYLLCWLYTLRSLVMAAFILLPITDFSVIVFAAAMGLLWLGTVPLTGAIVGQIFGLRYMATLFGFCFVSHQLGSFLGIWAGGRLYDLYGTYDVIWWAAVALGFIAALLHFPIDDKPVARLAPEGG